MQQQQTDQYDPRQSTAPLGLWHVTRGQRLRYVAAIIPLALATGFLFGVPAVAKLAIDMIEGLSLTGYAAPLEQFARHLAGFLPGGADRTNVLRVFLWMSAVIIVLLTAMGGFFQYLRGRYSAIAAEGIARRVRDHLFTQLQHLPASYHDTADTGDLVQRCSSDVETLRVFLASDIVEIGRALLLLAAVIPILFALDARLAVVALALMPFIFSLSAFFFWRIKSMFKITDEAEANMTTTLQENLTGIRVVRAFARQDYEISKFGARNAKFRDLNTRLMALMALYFACADFLSILQLALVLAFGAYWIADHSITVGTLFAFLMYESMVIWPLRQMGRILTDSGKAAVSLGRINEVLSQTAEDREQISELGRGGGAIAFEHLTFGYQAGAPVLHDLSFRVAPGETLAIVGPPGAGKTTIVRLLLRLYDYDSGSITLDGRDLRGLDRKYVRSQFGVVLQEPFMYSRSIAANLRVARPTADQAALIAATEDAAIHESIERFTDGYEAMVGERGVTLSGGQRQRLALARALLRDPPILILDDALSAVDTGTEQRILTALGRRKGRHTTIVIAHRLTSVMHADRILVLDHGRCAQLGSHAQLIAVDGPYRRLCEIQGNLEAVIRADLQETARGAAAEQRV